MGEMHTNILVRKSERKRPLGRPRSECEDNTKMDIKIYEYYVDSQITNATDIK
jgi:hypothetical protein